MNYLTVNYRELITVSLFSGLLINHKLTNELCDNVERIFLTEAALYNHTALRDYLTMIYPLTISTAVTNSI